MANHKLWRLPNLRGSLGLSAGFVLSLLLVACGSTADGDRLDFEATLAGQSIADSSPTNPVEIDDEQVTILAMDITNPGPEPVTVAHVRLEGRLLELIFLTYDTGVNTTIAPGETRRVAFPIDFFDLGGQANGLLRSTVRLHDSDRTVLASESLTIEANGDLGSNMSLFTIGLALAAAVTFGWNLIKVARRKLPANRFLRGLRFLYSGVAAGLAISAASSTLGIWPLAVGVWVPLTAAAGLAAFAVGYLAPGRLIDYIDEDDEAYPPLIDLRTVPATAPQATQPPFPSAAASPVDPGSPPMPATPAAASPAPDQVPLGPALDQDPTAPITPSPPPDPSQNR